ncbi:uncharacterized protein TrAFT101_005549 [Trichoderma asperellum]|uniref:uncharacterized protein n=1 Tax=Trichoderma asperellum TaxID=101201 RepID=UPI00331AF0A1|nr:hypothetical protein TrAFT101_005549 [Trichoderma asperellum]
MSTASPSPHDAPEAQLRDIHGATSFCYQPPWPSTVAPSTPYSQHSRNNYAFLDERRSCSYKGPLLQEQRTQLVPNSSLLRVQDLARPHSVAGLLGSCSSLIWLPSRFSSLQSLSNNMIIKAESMQYREIQRCAYTVRGPSYDDSLHK